MAITAVNITVRRNEFAPRFTKSEYRTDPPISEYTEVGTSLLRVDANDKDGVSISCLYYCKTYCQSYSKHEPLVHTAVK